MLNSDVYVKAEDSCVTPVNDRTQAIYNIKAHALIGVSPFNSYFSTENLYKLINWAMNHFDKFNIFLPDEISYYTLRALGYSDSRAKFKTKRQDAYLLNKVIKAFNMNGIFSEEATEKIICMSDLFQNNSYLSLLKEIEEKYSTDFEFKNGCLAMSSWVLNNSSKKNGDVEIDTAVKYILYEMPLFINTPKILNVSSSVFIYQSTPAYLKEMYTNVGATIFVSKC